MVRIREELSTVLAVHCSGEDPGVVEYGPSSGKDPGGVDPDSTIQEKLDPVTT